VFSQVGLPELLIVLLIVLVIFGPKRLPRLGRQLGKGLREFKDSLAGDKRPDEDDDESPATPRGELPPGSEAASADSEPAEAPADRRG
jgi:sec-independent protein translocase protein TatA